MSCNLTSKDKRLIKLVLSARSNLESYIRLIWPIINPGVKLSWNWHLSEICRHLQALTDGTLKTLLINVPPATSKTSIISLLWPTWVWGRFPEKRFLLSAWAKENLIREQRVRIGIVESEIYRDIFPNWKDGSVSVPKGSARVTDYTNSAKGCYRISSVGSKGLRGFHADYGVVDDPNPGDSDPATDAEAVEWWSGTASTRFRTPSDVRFVGIQQRTSLSDLSAYWLDLGLIDAHLTYPARFDPKLDVGFSPIGYVEQRKGNSGELLWPTRLSPDVLDRKLKELGTRRYSAQYQQSPQGAGEQVFQAGWWQSYSTLPDRPEQIVGTCDPAEGKRDGDYTVLQVWYRVGARLYLADQYRSRAPHSVQVAEIIEFCRRHPRASWWVEKKSLGAAIISALGQGGILARPWASQSPKVERILSCVPLAEAGLIYLPMSAQGTSIKSEADTWSPLGSSASAHDDQLDALAMAVNLMGRQIASARGLGESGDGGRGLLNAFRFGR